MTRPDYAAIQQLLTLLLENHIKLLRRGNDELHAGRLSDDQLEGVLVGTAMLAVDYATAALGLLLSVDLNAAATQMIAEIEANPPELAMPTNPDQVAALRHTAARLLAGTWTAGELTANVYASSWPDDFPELCLSVAARALVQHEIDEVLDDPDGDNRGNGGESGR